MAYERVNWENLPSTKTPVNADNLNKMDKGIANVSARMEYVTNNKVLSSIEARSDGVYNGVSGKKLAEQSNGWTVATITSAIGGTVRYTKIGNIVIVTFDDIQLKSNITHGTILVSGLPITTTYQKTLLNNYEAPSRPIRVAINQGSGQIFSHHTDLSSSTENYYGTLIYITNE